MSGDGFVRADRLPSSVAAGPALARADDAETTVGVAVVAADVSLELAKRVWDTNLRFVDVIMSDTACYDEISGSREMNRTGATRLGLAFGLSIEERAVEEGRVELADGEGFDYRYRVRVRVSKRERFVDGIGSCRISEIPATTKKGEPVPLSQREHFALTKAWTRATKRAIADILGGTD